MGNVVLAPAPIFNNIGFHRKRLASLFRLHTVPFSRHERILYIAPRLKIETWVTYRVKM